jgi:hypothetical protein
MDQKEIDRTYDEAMLTLTGSKEWDLLKDELIKEIYQMQCNLIDNCKNWDQFVYTKGWAECLAYIIRLRERTKASMENADADV